ncbi:MAG: hypothetical protein ABIS01_07360 [Ferruginibacter sp.]
MKSIMLLMIVCGWWHKAVSQSQGGLEQYYYVDNKGVSITPIAWYQNEKGWYAEGRYNYEAEKTLSLYAGKTFENKAKVSYAVSAMMGVVIGKLNGASIAVNTDLDYKKLFFSLQSQYTFSLKDRNANFLYNWCDLGYRLSPGFSAGISLQQTNLYETIAASEKGFFVKAEFGRWAFPLYIFNISNNGRYAVMGLSFTWEYKNARRNVVSL